MASNHSPAEDISTIVQTCAGAGIGGARQGSCVFWPHHRPEFPVPIGSSTCVQEHVTKWVIRFQGGAWCWDKESCDARMLRTPYLMSSSLVPPSTSAYAHAEGIPDVVLRPDGILSRNPERNPLFHSWTHVYVWYCSSDSHLGDAPAGLEQTGNWQFRGKRNVAALVRDLIENHGLADATDVLITGDSAGGVAALNNADFMHRILKPVAHHLVRFKTFVDAGWFLDIPSYTDASGAFTFRMVAKSLQRKWNASFDSTCEAAFGRDAWRCFHAQYAVCHIPTPLLFHQYIYDSANLGYDQASGADYPDFRQQFLLALAQADEPLAAAPGPGPAAKPPPRPVEGAPPSGGGPRLGVSGGVTFGGAPALASAAAAAKVTAGAGATLVGAGLSGLGFSGGISSHVEGAVAPSAEVSALRDPTRDAGPRYRADVGGWTAALDVPSPPTPAPAPTSLATHDGPPTRSDGAAPAPAASPSHDGHHDSVSPPPPSPRARLGPVGWAIWDIFPFSLAADRAATSRLNARGPGGAPSGEASVAGARNPTAASPEHENSVDNVHDSNGPNMSPVTSEPARRPKSLVQKNVYTTEGALDQESNSEPLLPATIHNPTSTSAASTPREFASPHIPTGTTKARTASTRQLPSNLVPNPGPAPTDRPDPDCAPTAGFGMFAPACHLHEMIDSDLFAYSHIGALRFMTVLEDWFWDLKPEASTRLDIDRFSGVRPAAQCEPAQTSRPLRSSRVSEDEAQQALSVDRAWAATMLGTSM